MPYPPQGNYPIAHAASHENGGTDAIAGALAAAAIPGHESTHRSGGADEIAGALAAAAIPQHKTTHQNGGSDEISVAGLSGALADAQTPAAHESTHVSGGSDDIDSALAAAAIPGHKTTHQNGGSDEISVAGLNGELADNQPPKTHQATHINGGADELSTIAGLTGPVSAIQSDALTDDDTTTSATMADTSLSITRTSQSGNAVIALATLSTKHSGDHQYGNVQLVLDGVVKAATHGEFDNADSPKDMNMTLVGAIAGDGASQILKVQFAEESSGYDFKILADDPVANLSSTLYVIEVGGS